MLIFNPILWNPFLLYNKIIECTNKIVNTFRKKIQMEYKYKFTEYYDLVKSFGLYAELRLNTISPVIRITPEMKLRLMLFSKTASQAIAIS